MSERGFTDIWDNNSWYFSLNSKNIRKYKNLNALNLNNYSTSNKKPKRLENSQLLRKTWHVNQIFELILEQCIANYY